MAKTIKLEEQTYHGLDNLRGKGETFSQVVGRLLKVAGVIYDVKEILGPTHYLMERPVSGGQAKTSPD